MERLREPISRSPREAWMAGDERSVVDSGALATGASLARGTVNR